MLLKVIILVGLAVYLLLQGAWILSILCLLCLIPIPVYALWVAIITAVVLLLSPYKITGVILGLFIVFTLVGNRVMQKARRTKYDDTSDITVNFIRYCKEYLITMRCFDEHDADVAVLDPHLGEIMDEIKGKWAIKIAASGKDPDVYLTAFTFDSADMQVINYALNEYSKTYGSRKEAILEYLRSIDHPAGYQ